MKRNALRLMAGLTVIGLTFAGCSPQATTTSKEAAITVEADEASGLKTLTLSAHAAQRLGVQTADVADRGAGTVIPYAAVIYDATGGTWAYTTSESLVFKRAAIAIEDITGDEAFLSDGPPSGTSVVTVGAAELYGAETGVGGGH
jgi:hypothetical protein